MHRKVVFVTGSSRGLGKAIILKFAKNDYNVVINYNKSQDDALNLAKYIEENYAVEALVCQGDISNEDDINKIVAEIKNKFGYVDVLINNAGIAHDCLPDEKTKESFNEILNVNLVGPFLITKAIKPLMQEGSIINISSTNAINTNYPYSLDYDASKAGLISLTHNLAKLYSPNIRVNALACGWIETDMNKGMDIEYKKDEENKCLLKRFAHSDEIANVVFFLASNEASYINDAIIRVDGGYNG